MSRTNSKIQLGNQLGSVSIIKRETIEDGQIMEENATNSEIIKTVKNYEQTKDLVEIDIQKLLKISEKRDISKEDIIAATKPCTAS